MFFLISLPPSLSTTICVRTQRIRVCTKSRPQSAPGKFFFFLFFRHPHACPQPTHTQHTRNRVSHLHPVSFGFFLLSSLPSLSIRIHHHASSASTARAHATCVRTQSRPPSVPSKFFSFFLLFFFTLTCVDHHLRPHWTTRNASAPNRTHHPHPSPSASADCRQYICMPTRPHATHTPAIVSAQHESARTCRTSWPSVVYHTYIDTIVPVGVPTCGYTHGCFALTLTLVPVPMGLYPR